MILKSEKDVLKTIRQEDNIDMLNSMKIPFRYIISTIALTFGLMVFLYGSVLIVDTYQRESIYIETVRLGKPPVNEHALLVEKRGLKNGLIHILIQVSGASLTVLSCFYLTRKK